MIHIFPVAYLEDPHFLAPVIDKINEAILSLAHPVAIRRSGEHVETMRRRVVREGLNSSDVTLTLGLGSGNWTWCNCWFTAQSHDFIGEKLSVESFVRGLDEEELRQLRAIRAGGICGIGDILDDRAQFTGEVFIRVGES